ncbi:MAG: hypothetical protein IPP77_00630 [Bacteroidetes bacterium]|nr:hypothetical protein [Bacteroidota bacterium]
MKVHILEDKVALEERATEEVEFNLETPVVTKVVSDEPEVAPMFSFTLEDDQPYSLFSAQDTEDELSVEQPDYMVEFDVTRDEQLISEEIAEEEQESIEAEQEEIEEVILPVVEKKVEEVSMFTRKVYEPEFTASNGQNGSNTQVEDRKKILADLSYRFGNKNNHTELEKEPAYKRRGLEFDSDKSFSTQNDVSRYSVSDNEVNRPEIKRTIRSYMIM